MNNKRTVKSICLFISLLLAVLFVTSGCDEVLITTVPSWARGNWSTYKPSEIINQITAVEITSKEFIPRDGLSDYPLIERRKVTAVIGDTIYFDLMTVEKGEANQIKVGFAGDSIITLYRKQ